MGACPATKSIHVWVPTASCVAANVTVVAVWKCSAPRVRSRLTSYASTVRAAARAAASSRVMFMAAAVVTVGLLLGSGGCGTAGRL